MHLAMNGPSSGIDVGPFIGSFGTIRIVLRKRCERLLTRNGRQACYATGAEFGDVKRFTFEYRGLSYQVQTRLMTSIGLSQSGNMIPSER